MAYDFSDLEILTFEGINDEPREPTATLAGNGSHLVTSYNELLDRLTLFFNGLEQPNDTPDSTQRKWTIVDSDYSAQNGESILVYLEGTADSVNINLPGTQGGGENSTGKVIQVININAASVTVTGESNSGFLYEGSVVDYLLLNTTRSLATLVYVNDSFGWFLVSGNATSFQSTLE